MEFYQHEKEIFNFYFLSMIQNYCFSKRNIATSVKLLIKKIRKKYVWFVISNWEKYCSFGRDIVRIYVNLRGLGVKSIHLNLMILLRSAIIATIIVINGEIDFQIGFALNRNSIFNSFWNLNGRKLRNLFAFDMRIFFILFLILFIFIFRTKVLLPTVDF